MRTEVKLRAEKRAERGKGAARKLRAGGRVPAVLYGKDAETVHLSVGAHEAELLFHSISVENTIIGLEIAGEAGPVQSLVREIQVHPYRPVLVHVDFLRIREGERLELEVPVHLIGIPAGVRNSGGVLQQSVHEVAVACLPSQIPESIDLDVTALEIGDALHVSDVGEMEGVEILLDPELTICSVALPRVEVEPEEEEAVEGEEAEAAAEGEAEAEAGAEDEDEASDD